MTVELFFPGKLRNPLNTHGSTRGRIGEGLAWKNVVRICWLAAAKPSLQGPAVVQMTARVSRPWDSQEGLGAACKHIRDEAVRLILDGNPPRLTDKNGRLYDTPANDGPASGHLFLPVKQEIVKPGERGVLITIEPLSVEQAQDAARRGDEAMSAGAVYRIQDAEGRGPYRPGFSSRWCDEDGPIKLTFADEFGWSMASIPRRFFPGEHAGCGFRLLDQLCDWFTPAERRKLADFRYQIVLMTIDRVLAESENQVVFARMRPLTEGVVIIPWEIAGTANPR